MSRTAQNMKKLIERKYYTAKETALEKLDLLMLASRISDEEYTDLIMLIDTVYNPLAPEPDLPVDPPADPDQVL